MRGGAEAFVCGMGAAGTYTGERQLYKGCQKVPTKQPQEVQGQWIQAYADPELQFGRSWACVSRVVLDQACRARTQLMEAQCKWHKLYAARSTRLHVSHAWSFRGS